MLKVPFGMKGATHHHGGYRVLENQLLLVVGFQYHRILVEGADSSRQFHSAEQINGDDELVLAGCIEKCILYVLC